MKPQTSEQPKTATPAPKGPAVLIVNVKSRRGREWYPQVLESLKKEGIALAAIHRLHSGKRIAGIVKQAVAAKIPLVIAGGGDGTLSAVAKHLCGSATAMGIIPLGTGNSFARDLEIPPNVQAACEIIANGKLAKIDMGLANERTFVNVATVGLSTRIAEALTEQRKKRLGRLVYVFAIIRAMIVAKPFDLTITTEKGPESFKALQFVIGSGRFHAGPFPLTPSAHITDRQLNGYILATTRRPVLLKYALHLWGGHHVNMPEIHAFETRHLKLETTPSKRVTIDGEIVAHTPIEFQIAPGALNVVVPQEFGG